ncbi:MAG: ABC transporter permease [Pirellula sp.]|nr:ABC transporter permease [Pirellula sp.]
MLPSSLQLDAIRAPLFGCGLVALLLLSGRIPLSYNLYNLLVRWRATVLTLAAFAMVTGLLVVMLAFVNGMYVLTLGSGRPGNLIVMSEGSTDESFSNLGYSDVGDIENQSGILREGDRPLLSRETYLILTQPLPPRAAEEPSFRNLYGLAPPAKPPSRRFLQVRCLDDPLLSARVHKLELFEGGRWFSEAGVSAAKPRAGAAATANEPLAIEVVMGEGIAKQMARDRGEDPRTKPRLDVGDTFELGNRTWVITGVMRSEGLTFDSEVWAKRSLVGPMFGKETYSSLVALTGGEDEARKLKEFLNNDYKKAAVNATLETDYYKSLNETNKQFLVAIVFLTAFFAVGGVFGVMNTMFAAISQRTRDIGVLRLLGFTRWQVLVSFLLESIMIALIGGAIGCALGSLSDGTTANSIVGGQGGGKFVVLRLTVDAATIYSAMLLALSMGIVGGLLPALKAIRLKILNSLR